MSTVNLVIHQDIMRFYKIAARFRVREMGYLWHQAEGQIAMKVPSRQYANTGPGLRHVDATRP